MVPRIFGLFPLSSLLWAFPNTRLFVSGNLIQTILAKAVSNCCKQFLKSHSCHPSSALERHMVSFPLIKQLNNLWETWEKSEGVVSKFLLPFPFSSTSSKRFYLLVIIFFEIKETDTSTCDLFGPWINHSNELFQDDGLQKACCVHKHMEVVWHFCKYYFVQSYCLKTKALGISVQFFQLGECFVFKVRSMFKFSNFRHSS